MTNLDLSALRYLHCVAVDTPSSTTNRSTALACEAALRRCHAYATGTASAMEDRRCGHVSQRET
ncbi:hypothetical protein GLA29479_2415 [Lysobacter antibioticus]|nr:hypothetical protein GLA29479_2415 [Lysobacter antibioticus]